MPCGVDLNMLSRLNQRFQGRANHLIHSSGPPAWTVSSLRGFISFLLFSSLLFGNFALALGQSTVNTKNGRIWVPAEVPATVSRSRNEPGGFIDSMNAQLWNSTMLNLLTNQYGNTGQLTPVNNIPASQYGSVNLQQWQSYQRDSPILYPQGYPGYAQVPDCQNPAYRSLVNDFRKYNARSTFSTASITEKTQAIGDQCELPQLIGTGPYRIPQWYFNMNTRRCELFYYSGCCGNANNFPTYEACQLICEVDPCTQPRDPGLGSLQLPRFYFNRAAKLCEPFTYFGSGGSRNNFATVVECRTRCPESPNPCPYGEPIRQAGGGLGFLPCGMVSMNTCPVNFYCHVGSSISTTLCCPKPATAPDRCHQPQRMGVGSESLPRWYFDQNSLECKPFHYRGLQGNENNFLSKSDCDNMCFANPCGTGQALRASGQVARCQPSSIRSSCPERYYCHVGVDARTTVCCPRMGDPCRQEMKTGFGSFTVGLLRWWHDPSTGGCRPFNYTGMGGNENNFVTESDCRMKCKVFTNACSSGKPTLSSTGLPMQCQRKGDCPVGHWCHIGTSVASTMCCIGAVHNPCLATPSIGLGSENVSRWFYDARVYKCMPFIYTGIGGNENNFLSKEDCLRSCPEIINPCPMGDPVMEPGPGGFVLPLSCNPTSAQGACPQNSWCHIGDSNDTTTCCSRTSVHDPCILPMSPGKGRSRLHRWYFNVQTLSCQPFAYNGIRGNENNFLTKEICESQCPVFRNPCLGGPVQDDGHGRPQTCMVSRNVTTNPCRPGYYCHVGGSLENTVCCPSVGVACHLPVAVGVGNLSLPRFYFHHGTRQCLPFQYRGSHGNDNNFLSEAACAAQCPGKD